MQIVWSQKLVCGLFANNVASFAVIVGPTSRMFAANVGRRVPLFVGQPPDDCGPLQIPLGEHPPFAAPIDARKERIDHRAPRELAMAPTRLGGRDPIFATMPFGISQVCRVEFRSHPSSVPN